MEFALRKSRENCRRVFTTNGVEYINRKGAETQRVIETQY